MKRTCKDCGIEFDKKKSKKGLYIQCDECSENDDTVRYVGFNDGTLNKSVHTSIYRGTDKNVIKHILKKQQNVS
jgi:hypothetical protein